MHDAQAAVPYADAATPAYPLTSRPVIHTIGPAGCPGELLTAESWFEVNSQRMKK